MEDRSEGQHPTMERLMRFTSVARNCLGPADRGDAAAPVVHKHDDLENEVDEQLAGLDIELDSHHQHYAVRREEQPGSTNS